MAGNDNRWTDPRFVWNKLRYDRDAIVEASAGTGKTFALESIVVKLIREKGYDAKEILLVTFTEKAAAELKNRVRKTLEAEGRLPADFDEMTICTIHSFCRRILSEFAFENGVPMQCEFGGDGGSLARLAVLNALKSDDFKAECPDGLFAALREADVKSVADLVSDVEKRIGNTTPDEWRDELDAAVGNAGPAVRKAHAALVALGVGNVGEYVMRMSGAKPNFYEWLAGAFDSLADPDGDAFKDWLAKFSGNWTTNNKIKAWDGVSFEKNEEIFHVDAAKFLQGPIEDLVAALGKRSKVAVKKQQRQLAVKLLERAIPRFEELKKSAALLSFDDMVTRAAEVVRKKTGTPAEEDTKRRFFQAVREQWRVALVDEFQDTDGNQWDIFRTLFSAAENKVEGGKPGFLIVVGDPKQAIYGWRGADVRVYCDARDAITGGNGEKLTLEETFRAKPKLVEAFNVFFRNDGAGKPGSDWFKDGAAGEKIDYEDVRYPADGNEKFGDGKDDDGNRGPGLVDEAEPDPVRLLESIPGRMRDAPPPNGAFGNADVCLPVFLENAALEMMRLHALDPAYRTTDKDGNLQPHRFRYRDMCVLVKARKHAAAVRRALSRHGIPFGQYKQPGLFDSPEAEGVLALLDYLEKPNDAGNRSALLLSPLFGIEPAHLPEFATFPAFDAFVEGLREHARKREWSELFEAAMSGRCTALASPGGGDIHEFNRVRAAVRRIFDLLLAKRGLLARTVADFSAELRAWRRNDKSAGENAELFGKDSDADRVQIMTMHAAKGLEFPVVFVAAGFSAPFARNKTPEDEQAALREEIRRLFYVALTRAGHRIYLPWSKNAWETGIGTNGSPLLVRSDDGGGFLGRAVQTWFDTLAKRAGALPEECAAPAAGTAAATPPTASQTRTPAEGDAGETRPVVEIEDAGELGLKWRKNLRLQWNSFSSLHEKTKGKGDMPDVKPPPVAQGPGSKEAEETDEPLVDPETASETAPGKKKSLLPGGNVCGNVFHQTMEALCKNNEEAGEVGFTNAHDPDKEAELLDLIREKMRANAVKSSTGDDGETTEKAFLELVRHALDIELVFGDRRFRLKSIPRKDRCAETKFYAWEKAKGILEGRLPEDRDGALNGEIDLLVRVGKEVFVIDWKTNSLAKYDDPRERRGRSHVEAAMDEAGYHLQYQLYALAAAAWLDGHEETLAGVAYLFVRAHLEGVANDVFSTPVDAAALEEFRGKVLANPAFKA